MSPPPESLDKPSLLLSLAGFVFVNIGVLLHLLTDASRWLIVAFVVVGGLLALGAFFRLRRSAPPSNPDNGPH